MGATREVAHLAEIRERNRIAREIHDHVGHSLAGILLQLQVAQKVSDQDDKKAREMVENSITRLAEAVELLQDTVHNLKPEERLGIDYLHKVITNFQFCPVHFEHWGDFESLTASHVEIISVTLKEALTNAARHSHATRVDVRLEIRKNIVRLYFKDNGKGCPYIHEGLGISGMKERVRNVGGHISFTPQNGFMIVGVLPVEGKFRGVAVIEGTNR